MVQSYDRKIIASEIFLWRERIKKNKYLAACGHMVVVESGRVSPSLLHCIA